MALFWINSGGQYKQFVENRVQKNRVQPDITWRHVPTQDTPADVASRGGDFEFREVWWHGPEWMAVRHISEHWPPEQVIQPSAASSVEVKVIKEVLKVSFDVTDRMYGVLEMFESSKAINICAWISRFLHKKSQQSVNSKIIRFRLNLQPNQDGILQCRVGFRDSIPYTSQTNICIPRNLFIMNTCGPSMGEWH